jgi:hypothetical protein
MADEAIITPEAEVKAPEITPEVKEVPKEPITPEVTISEIIKDDEVKPNLIPESVFLGEKKARKAAERELKALKESIENGMTPSDISNEIDEIADEHNIDKAFLQKLASTIKTQTEKDLDEKYQSKFKKEEKAESFDVAFDKAYKVALERGQEFEKIANPEIIKTLAMQPQNAKKTISQILEETYGNALTGKRTIETTTPGGGKDPEPLDYDKATKDINYLKEVLANPELKAKYNSMMISKGY